MKWMMAALLGLAGNLQQAQDYENLLKDAKLTISEGVALAMKEAKGEGVPYKVELEGDKEVHWAVDIAQGQKVLALDVEVKAGKIVGTDLEDTDKSALAKAAKIPLLKAIESALKKTPGRAVSAEFKVAGGKAEAHVLILVKGEVKEVVVDASSGEASGKAGARDAAPEKLFTESFAIAEGELASTGRNPYFVLEPGFVLVLEGKEDGKDVRMQITVLNETKKIAGVDCRVVEDRVTENGVLKELTKDYFAISRRTSDVYYFGEDVDNYKDGKVVNHDGSWLAGEKGSKFGLQMPGTPLIGARFYQEQAPGVGMDRIEVVSVSEKVETPAGKFERCLKTEETTPLEPAVRDYKLYAPGIGLVQEGDLKLVKYGPSKN